MKDEMRTELMKDKVSLDNPKDFEVKEGDKEFKELQKENDRIRKEIGNELEKLWNKLNDLSGGKNAS